MRPPETHPSVAVILAELQGRLLGLYLYGSAVTGGLRPNSDLDFLAVLNAPLAERERAALVRALLPLSGSGAANSAARPVDLTAVVVDDIVPWRYPPRRELVYGEWLRAELDAGRIAPPGPDPDLAIVLVTARASSIPLLGPPAEALLDAVPFADVRRAIADSLPGLVRGLAGDERNVVLTLTRMWTTLLTHEIVPKDVAAARMLEHLPARLAPTLELARSGYLGEVADDWSAPRAQAAALAEHVVGQVERLLAGGVGPADRARGAGTDPA